MNEALAKAEIDIALLPIKVCLALSHRAGRAA
jgi:hypothetical protein